MVSDVLAQALIDIAPYMTGHFYDEAETAMINALRGHMGAVLEYLDTPPGTNRETVEQNNA